MEGQNVESNEIVTGFEIVDSLKTLSKEDWERADWPVISYVEKERFYIPSNKTELSMQFWKDVLHPSHFLTPKNANEFNSDRHTLFVIHSFLEEKGKERFKTVTTTDLKEFLKDPANNINYNHHGKPCEVRSNGSYPTIEFWEDFYDNDKLTNEEKDNYPIPSQQWRKKFILEKYFSS